MIALGALLVGIGFGVGLGSTKAPRAVTVTAPAQTVVQTVRGPIRTVVHVRKVPGPTTTVTETVQASAAAPSSPAPAAATSGGGGYSGNGQQQVGTINVARDSTLKWTCSGEGTIFSIVNDLSSDAFSGVIPLQRVRGERR